MWPLFSENRVVNWHEHVWSGPDGALDAGRLAELMRAVDTFDMDVVAVSNPDTGTRATPEDCARRNDIVREAVARHPDRLRGMCFVNPGYTREALDEVERCVGRLGFVGVKLYHQYRISDPAMRALIGLCIDMDIPILMHAGKLTHRPEDQPFLSDGTHFARAAEAFPDATFIHAHIGGGGDWQYGLKAIAPYPNIFTDISGSVCDTGLIEATTAALGAGRMLFGTDMSYSTCVGKILAADISAADKITILANPAFERFLTRKEVG